MLKKIFISLIVLCCIIIYIIYYNSTIPKGQSENQQQIQNEQVTPAPKPSVRELVSLSIKEIDSKDSESLKYFIESTSEEVDNLVLNNLDGFIDDFISIKIFDFYNFNFLRTVKDIVLCENFTTEEKVKLLADYFKESKDGYLKQIWDTHFNAGLNNIISNRVMILCEDISTNNEHLIRNVSQNVATFDGFDKKIRDDLYQSISNAGVEITNDSVNKKILHEAIALSAGVAAGHVIAVCFKSNIWSLVAGILVDIGVSEILSMQLEAHMKPQLEAELKKSIHVALDGENGLFLKFKNAINTFHNARKEDIMRVI